MFHSRHWKKDATARRTAVIGEMESPHSIVDKVGPFPSWRLSVQADELQLVPQSTWRQTRPYLLWPAVFVFAVMAGFQVFGEAKLPSWAFYFMGLALFSVYMLVWAVDRCHAADAPYLIVRRVEGEVELPRYHVHETLDRLVALGVRQAVDVGGTISDERDVLFALFVVLEHEKEKATYDLVANGMKRDVVNLAVRMSELLGIPVYFGVRGTM